MSTKEQMVAQRQRRWARRLEQGLCVDCGKAPIAASSKRNCTSCLRKRVKQNQTPEGKVRAATQQRRRYREIREQVIDHYTDGNRSCMCPGCRVTGLEFLTLDHVENNGSDHRKEIPSGMKLFRWCIQNNFPAEIQVLCWNCNTAKQFYGDGTCPCQGMPHTEKTLETHRK